MPGHIPRSLAIQVLCVACLYLVGCGQYGSLSPLGYDYATALHSISRKKSPEKLPILRKKIVHSFEQGDLSEQEHNWLESILDTADQGNWSRAIEASRNLLEAQVTRP